QQDRFALLSDPGGSSDATFVETTDYAPDQSIPMGVYQRSPNGGGPDRLIGAARLELPGATVIETMIQLRPGTPAALAMARRQAAELGGFATSLDLDKATLVDVIDALVAVIVRLARQYDIAWLWIFPRKGMISVLRAAVPGLLPPYRFSYCPDWQGWREDSPQYQQFRALGLRGIPDQPQLFQISLEDFAADLSRRLALRSARIARAAELEEHYRAAMWQAERDINDEIVRRHHETHDFGAVLRNELDLQPGVRVLNPDCGAGQNLAWLYERTGERGVVVGLEEDAALIQHARETIGEPERGNVVIFQGSSQHPTFPDGLFDRIYADRALSRTCDASGSLAELRRVLAPGGILSVTVPNWNTLEVVMGRYRSEDDTVVLTRLRKWYHQTFPARPHQADLLKMLNRTAWQTLRVTESHVTFTDLARVRALLLLPEAGHALAGHDQVFARQLTAFERRMERAERAVSLAVRVTLLYVWAQRPICPPERE
ncbi:MAG: methyltransferase domain-containing protein, partial [Ktedonobacterales bacterium]